MKSTKRKSDRTKLEELRRRIESFNRKAAERRETRGSRYVCGDHIKNRTPVVVSEIRTMVETATECGYTVRVSLRADGGLSFDLVEVTPRYV